MHRISVSVEPAVYQLIKGKTNKSKYVSDLILRDAYEVHRDALAVRTKQSILEDSEFIDALVATITERIRTTQPTNWGA